MAIYSNKKKITKIYWVDCPDDVLERLRIVRVYNNKKLLWELENN